jgi:hypothetical protein
MIDPSRSVEATPVEIPAVLKVQVPQGLSPGDTFIVTPSDGRVFTVIVPDGATPGTWIEVIMPTEVEGVVNNESSKDSPTFKVPKAAAGAAVAGGVVGGLLCMTIGAPVILGAAVAGGLGAYATTRKDDKIGDQSRYVGRKTYSGVVSATKMASKSIQKASSSVQEEARKRGYSK